LFNTAIVQKVFYKTSERTLKTKKIFFVDCIFIIIFDNDYYRKGLYQVDFWAQAQAGSNKQEFVFIWLSQNNGPFEVVFE